jgi:hypothetical protein
MPFGLASATMSWGTQGPQGPQGYPQPGYPPQQPQPQQYGAAPPPKKGMGVGLIIALVVGLLGLVVVCGGAATYFVLRDSSSESSSSASTSSNGDHSAALKTKAEALVAAVKTGKAKEVEGPLLEFATLPETAKPWFEATFEPKAAEDLYGYWDRQVFPNITDLAKTFKNATDMNRTEVRVTRLASMADVEACQLDFCKFREKRNLTKLFAAMKKPQALYVVSLAGPGSKPGEDEDQVFYFAEIKGSFAYLESLMM